MAAAFQDLAASRPGGQVPGRPGPRPCRPALRVVVGGKRARRRDARAEVYRRRRRVATLLAAGVVVAAWIAGQSWVATSTPTSPDRTTATVTAGSATALGAEGTAPQGEVVIKAGDTLWDLVGPLAPSGTSRQAWIARVVEENGLDPGRLVPGAVIRLPPRGTPSSEGSAQVAGRRY